MCYNNYRKRGESNDRLLDSWLDNNRMLWYVLIDKNIFLKNFKKSIDKPNIL